MGVNSSPCLAEAYEAGLDSAVLNTNVPNPFNPAAQAELHDAWREGWLKGRSLRGLVGE